MTINLRTGLTGKSVPAAADRSLYAGIAGPDDYVLDDGAKLAASLRDANHLVVQDGSAIMCGAHVTFDGTTEFVIPSGVQGAKRSNIAVARFSTDGDTEKCDALVLSGEPVTDGTPPDPELSTGDIREGATVHDMKLYRVVTDGITALTPEPLFSVLTPMSELQRACDSISRPPVTKLVMGGQVTVAAHGHATVTITPPTVKGYVPVGMVGATANSPWLDMAGFGWRETHGDITVRCPYDNSQTVTPAAWILYLPVV